MMMMVVGETIQMKEYTRMTDGSAMDTKESTLVWDYRFTYTDFGSCQALELMKHLTGLLSKDGVSIKNGRQILEVRPKELNKGLVAERLVRTVQKKGKPLDFVLGIGDDSSDEEMFDVITAAVTPVTEIFACTVGQKPTNATYYLDDTLVVPKLFHAFAASSDQDASSS